MFKVIIKDNEIRLRVIQEESSYTLKFDDAFGHKLYKHIIRIKRNKKQL